MARILDLDELPHEPHSHEFVGADHDDVPFSIILVHSQPGVGPKLHRHPYAEVFLIESGEATFQIGAERLVIPAGHVVVSPRGEAHGFVNSGSGELRLIAIHAAGSTRSGWPVQTCAISYSPLDGGRGQRNLKDALLACGPYWGRVRTAFPLFSGPDVAVMPPRRGRGGGLSGDCRGR